MILKNVLSYAKKIQKYSHGVTVIYTEIKNISIINLKLILKFEKNLL